MGGRASSLGFEDPLILDTERVHLLDASGTPKPGVYTVLTLRDVVLNEERAIRLANTIDFDEICPAAWLVVRLDRVSIDGERAAAAMIGQEQFHMLDLSASDIRPEIFAVIAARAAGLVVRPPTLPWIDTGVRGHVTYPELPPRVEVLVKPRAFNLGDGWVTVTKRHAARDLPIYRPNAPRQVPAALPDKDEPLDAQIAE